jgi:two-component system sensor histidine kinase UhpB
MRPGSLLTQVLMVNLLLVVAAVIAALLLTGSSLGESGTVGAVAAFAVAVALVINVFLISSRFQPLEQLVEDMERADLTGTVNGAGAEELRGPEEVRRLNRTFREMLARLEAERRAVTSAALEAQERERSRIALDLHDEVNQSLTGVLLRLETLRRSAPPELQPELAETREVAAKAMEELLALAHRLRPASLDDLGLRAAVAGLVEENGRAGLTTEFEYEGDVSAVPPEVQLVTYRVAQEALSNAVQHAGASRVRVHMSGAGGDLELEVADDGAGFDSADAAGGLGLAGMRERALMVGGSLDVRSRPGAGTRVTLRTAAADVA